MYLHNQNPNHFKNWQRKCLLLWHFSPPTVTFPLVHILIHLEVQVGTSQVGSCRQELQHILLLHLKDIQTSGHRDHFPCVTSEMGELEKKRWKAMVRSWKVDVQMSLSCLNSLSKTPKLDLLEFVQKGHNTTKTKVVQTRELQLATGH